MFDILQYCILVPNGGSSGENNVDSLMNELVKAENFEKFKNVLQGFCSFMGRQRSNKPAYWEKVELVSFCVTRPVSWGSSIAANNCEHVQRYTRLDWCYSWGESWESELSHEYSRNSCRPIIIASWDLIKITHVIYIYMYIATCFMIGLFSILWHVLAFDCTRG